jgi:hypothetical protein
MSGPFRWKGRVHPSHPQPRSPRSPGATAHGTRVRIGRNAGGHGEAGMESEEGTAFEFLPRRKPCRNKADQAFLPSINLKSAVSCLAGASSVCSCEPRRKLYSSHSRTDHRTGRPQVAHPGLNDSGFSASFDRRIAESSGLRRLAVPCCDKMKCAKTVSDDCFHTPPAWPVLARESFGRPAKKRFNRSQKWQDEFETRSGNLTAMEARSSTGLPTVKTARPRRQYPPESLHRDPDLLGRPFRREPASGSKRLGFPRPAAWSPSSCCHTPGCVVRPPRGYVRP